MYLLPSLPGLQDQTYVANLGAVLPHREPDTAIVSRFRSAPRVGEASIGAEFLRLLGFLVEQPPAELEGEPAFFEGEADLKHLRGNLYVGAYGLRSSRNVLRGPPSASRWTSCRFASPTRSCTTSTPAYCRITDETVLLCTAVADPICLRKLERHCEIVDVIARAGLRRDDERALALGRAALQLGRRGDGPG